MPSHKEKIAASLSADLSGRLRDLSSNAAILGVVALLALTVWVACIAGLVAVLAPLWGMAVALFSVALLVAVLALILLALLKHRTRMQRIRADIRKAENRNTSRAALLAALPGLMRNRSSVMVVVSGLAIGAMIAAALKTDDESNNGN